MYHRWGKRFLNAGGASEEREYDFVYYGGYHPEMGQILRQAPRQG